MTRRGQDDGRRRDAGAWGGKSELKATQRDHEGIAFQDAVTMPRGLRNRWPQIAQEWSRQAPGMFTIQDLSRTETQPGYGFPEWFLAMHLRARGYAAMLKYGNNADAWKVSRLDQLIGPRDARWIRECARRDNAGPPDLIVYDPLTWQPRFFAEAKLDRDRLRPNQRAAFEKIYRRLGLKIRVYPIRTPLRDAIQRKQI